MMLTSAADSALGQGVVVRLPVALTKDSGRYLGMLLAAGSSMVPRSSLCELRVEVVARVASTRRTYSPLEGLARNERPSCPDCTGLTGCALSAEASETRVRDGFSLDLLDDCLCDRVVRRRRD